MRGLTQEQAARILEPIWIGFEAALIRIEEELENLAPFEHATAGELYEASAYLKHRARNYQSSGLLIALDRGGKVLLWPNVIPTEAQRQATLGVWIEKSPAMREAVKRRARTDHERLDAVIERLQAKRLQAKKDAAELIAS